MWVTSSLGRDNISLQNPRLNSSTTTMLKANTFSYFGPQVVVFCCGGFFFFIFKRHWFMLNCIEIIFLSQRRQSPFLSRSPTSIKLLASCLLIFSFRNQQEDRQKLSLQRCELNQEQGALQGPGCTPKNTKCFNREQRFLILHSEIAAVPKEWCKNFPGKNKRQERSRGIWWRWGQRMQSSFLKCRKETLCSELMQLKMQIQADPKGSQMHVKLVKAKGSGKGCLTKGSLTTTLTFFF